MRDLSKCPLAHRIIKSPRPLRTALDHKSFLITDKHTEILDCIPCVMVIFLTNGRTDGRTDGRYQTYYLPCFAVDNKRVIKKSRKVNFKVRASYYS